MRVFDHFSAEELAILRSRAARIAVPLHIAEPEESVTILLVKINAEQYGLPMDGISAVYEDVQITPVPNVPEAALGIANIRGRIVFVLDLGSVLGLPTRRQENENLPVIVLTSALELAFQVNSVEGIETIPKAALTNNFPHLALTRKAFLEGISSDGKAVLNLNAILDNLVANNHSITA